MLLFYPLYLPKACIKLIVCPKTLIAKEIHKLRRQVSFLYIRPRTYRPINNSKKTYFDLNLGCFEQWPTYTLNRMFSYLQRGSFISDSNLAILFS